MTYVGVLEDDAVQREALSSMVRARYEACGDPVTLLPFEGGDDLMAYARSRQPLDILLADIVLNDEGAGGGAAETAVGLVKRLPASAGDVQVIYVTGYEGHHTDVYETDHACFLLKPVAREDLDFALSRAEDLGRRSCAAPFRVRSGSEDRIVRPAQVSYIESDRRILRIHVPGDVLETYGKLSDFERRLPKKFVRCHKSFLVNMDYVAVCRSSELVLSTGERVPVSQSRRRLAQETIRAYVRGMR